MGMRQECYVCDFINQKKIREELSMIKTRLIQECATHETEYMRGLYNGVEIACSIAFNRLPEFKQEAEE